MIKLLNNTTKFKHLKDIDIFSNAGIIPKTIVLSSNMKPKQDMKLEKIDFSEWNRDKNDFRDTSFYDFFNNNSLLFIIFKNNNNNNSIENNVFIGFKKITFSKEFIEKEVKPIWDNVTKNIKHKKIYVKNVLYKHNNNGHKKGDKRLNKNGNNEQTIIGFPKASQHHIFFRGSGINSNNKTLNLNGIRVYQQYFWFNRDFVKDSVKHLLNSN